jgi:hypothetical protein
MKRIAVLVVSIIFVAGCQTTDYTGDETSYRYRIPVGSTLTLNQPLTIPADRRSIYVFRGKVVIYKDVDIYYPHCQFRLNKIANHVRKVKPDTFIVTKISVWEDYHAQGPLRFADANIYTGVGTDAGASGRVVVGAGSGGGGPSIIKRATVISLQSGSQPEVQEIVCAHWGDRGDFYFNDMAIKEMRDALGNVFTINLKTQ